jgi:hypothetical protein
MQEQQEQIWINELKIDFPEYLEIIELLDWEVEQFLELAEEYYFCKHHIQMLKKSGKTNLLKEFQTLLADLKSDINSLLSKKKVKI